MKKRRSLGDVPCLFGTLTSQGYHWDGVISITAQVEELSDHKDLSELESGSKGSSAHRSMTSS